MRLFIARLGGVRVGYLLLLETGETVMITEAVSAACRGRGVARAMVEYAAQLCPHLTAEIRADNAASIALHERCGFVRVGERGELVVYQRVR